MCVLCRDTFSRSDILKRHFQKCSVRRGNPTGLSHLSSPAAHLKKSQAASAKASNDVPSSASTPTPTAVPNGSFPGTVLANGTVSSNSSNFSDPPQIPYNLGGAPPNNLQRPRSGQSYTPNGHPLGPSASNSWSIHETKANPMLFHAPPPTSEPFGMAATGVEDKRSVMPNSQPQPNDDWNHMFPSGNDGYGMNPMFAHPMTGTYDQGQADDMKKEYGTHQGGSNGYYMPSSSLGPDGK